MKKSWIVLSIAIMIFFGLSSCKRCEECSYVSNGTTISSGEVCGSRAELNDLETQYEASAAAAGTTASCSASR